MQGTGLSNRVKFISTSLRTGDRDEDGDFDDRNEPVIYRTRVNERIVEDYERRAKIKEAVANRTISTRYTNISDRVRLDESVMTWSDLEPGKKSTFLLKRIPYDNAAVNFAAKTFIELFTALSDHTVGKLLFLAYNLRNSAGEHLFEDPCDELIDSTQLLTYDELSNKIQHRETNKSPMSLVEEIEDEYDIANFMTSCCFLAATYLRLYTREAQSYAASETKLKETYKNMYGREIFVTKFHPQLNTIKQVKMILGNNDIIKNTFYVFLYAGETKKEGYDIKEFCYRRHISYTGMHAYTLFLRCAEAYSVDNNFLANVLHTSHFEKYLDAIEKLINGCALNVTDTEKRLMWKFARIFERKFCTILQTKNCPSFVAVLGHLLKQEIPSRENEDILKITHVATLPESAMIYAKSFSEGVRGFILRSRTDGHLTGLVDPF
jgi:hypothetical protein